MIIFGGVGQNFEYRNDIGVLDLNIMSWIPESNINPPMERFATSGVFVESIDAFLIYGGSNNTYHLLDDIWIFTFDDHTTTTSNQTSVTESTTTETPSTSIPSAESSSMITSETDTDTNGTGNTSRNIA